MKKSHSLLTIGFITTWNIIIFEEGDIIHGVIIIALMTLFAVFSFVPSKEFNKDNSRPND